MEQRKTDHIRMAAESAPATHTGDERFNYEPLLSAHPTQAVTVNFLGKTLQHPQWISSMTGGSKEAGQINRMLAEAAAEFGLGMGLGSCRTLLESQKHLDDFNLRPIIGNNLPLYANLGITQIEQLLSKKECDKAHNMVLNVLKADGLFIHINPTQEWLQPEGDRQLRPAIDIIEEFIEQVAGHYQIIIKEVGQGMGPESLQQLLKLNIDALEFGAFGGTNFANIEIMRAKGATQFMYPLATLGHSADQMLEMVNAIVEHNTVQCKNLILSGGLKNFLDGYYYTAKSKIPAVYGMAGVMLQHALRGKEDLFDFMRAEIEGYKYANAFLNIKSDL